MKFINRLTCGEEVLTIVQYIAWVDLLIYFVLIGPMILLFLAANGLDPSFRDQSYQVLDEKGEQVTKNATYALYNAERGMSEVELQIEERVRKGCGLLYSRDFPNIWKQGQPHLVSAAIVFCAAPSIAFLSAIVFMAVVPSNGTMGKYMPTIHLINQMLTVGLTILGCWQISNKDLCFLEYVWPKFQIQTGVVVFSLIVSLTYKAYEIVLIDAFCKVHLKSVMEREALIMSPSQEILNIMNSMKTHTEDSALPEPAPFTWGEADSDLQSILASFHSDLDHQHEDSQSGQTSSTQASTKTNYFSFSAKDSLSTTPSTLQLGQFTAPFSTTAAANNQGSQRKDESDMTVIFPATQNFKFDEFKF